MCADSPPFQRGADVTMSNVRGDSALHNAARWNHAPIVQLLMLYGAQYKATNNEGKTPLDLTKVTIIISQF